MAQAKKAKKKAASRSKSEAPFLPHDLLDMKGTIAPEEAADLARRVLRLAAKVGPSGEGPVDIQTAVENAFMSRLLHELDEFDAKLVLVDNPLNLTRRTFDLVDARPRLAKVLAEEKRSPKSQLDQGTRWWLRWTAIWRGALADDPPTEEQLKIVREFELNIAKKPNDEAARLLGEVFGSGTRKQDEARARQDKVKRMMRVTERQLLDFFLRSVLEPGKSIREAIMATYESHASNESDGAL